MLMALKLKFSHLDCKANPAAETGMAPIRISVLRTLLAQHKPKFEICAKGPSCHSCAIRHGCD